MRTLPLVEFYSGRSPDFAGRRIEDVWRMSLDELELTHDYIQWLFPLRERSGVQPDVPVLDDATVAAFTDPDLHARVVTSARVMATFYGFEIVENHGAFLVRRTAQFAERRHVWLTRGNHNFLRLTRIMKSLATLGHEALAAAWRDAVLGIYAENTETIGPVTARFWRAAIAPQPN